MNLSLIKSKLEQLKCSEHGSSPTVVTKTGGFSITNCCCEAFKTKVGERAKELIAEQAKSEIADTLNKAFKR